MSTYVKTRKLGRGALRTYAHLLNAGGWWDIRELADAVDVVAIESIYPQLHRLLFGQHIVRKGSGVRGDPYLYGVTAACVPVPGVTLQTEVCS